MVWSLMSACKTLLKVERSLEKLVNDPIFDASTLTISSSSCDFSIPLRSMMSLKYASAKRLDRYVIFCSRVRIDDTSGMPPNTA